MGYILSNTVIFIIHTVSDLFDQAVREFFCKMKIPNEPGVVVAVVVEQL